jgi:hypothetical protein
LIESMNQFLKPRHLAGARLHLLLVPPKKERLP